MPTVQLPSIMVVVLVNVLALLLQAVDFLVFYERLMSGGATDM